MMTKELTKEIAYKEVEYERNGKNVKAITHVYEILTHTGDLKNNEPHKHTEQKFIPLKEIKQIPYLSDATIFFLESIGFKRNAKLETTKNP